MGEVGHVRIKWILTAVLVVVLGASALPTHAADTNTIVLRITAMDGTPLTGTYGFAPESDGVWRGPYYTDSAGVATISGLANDSYRLRAGARGYLDALPGPVTVSGGQTLEVPVRLEKGGSIRVDGFAGMGGPTVYSTQTPPEPWYSRDLTATVGLPTGDYKVLFFMQGSQPGTFKRGWYGGGLLMSSGAIIRVNAPEEVVIQSPNDLPDLTSLPALASPSVTADPAGFTVVVDDPEGLSLGLNYEVEFRKVGGQWQTAMGVAGQSVRLLRNSSYSGLPGDQFEFRARVYQIGTWSNVVGPSRVGAAMMDGYTVTSPWSPARRSGIPFAKPGRVKKPVVWVEGRKRTLVWGPTSDAVRYRVSAKRNKGKWITLKPAWTTKAKMRIKGLKKGAWRFRVQANNPGGSAAWSKTSKVFTVG